PQPSSVSVLLGLGDGTFAPERRTAIAEPIHSQFTVIADLNGDGRSDVVVATVSATVSKVTALLGLADGTLAPEKQFEVAAQIDLMVAADFNGGGRLDLITEEESAEFETSVFLGRGDGTFAAMQHLTILGFADFLMSGDFNGDGRLDFAIHLRS